MPLIIEPLLPLYLQAIVPVVVLGAGLLFALQAKRKERNRSRRRTYDQIAKPSLIGRIIDKLQGKTTPPNLSDTEKYREAEALIKTIKDTMKHAPISSEQRTIIKNQTKKLLNNIARSLWRLHRIYKFERMLYYRPQQRSELQNMKEQLIAQMDQSLELLSSIPIALMKVEFAQDDRVDRIITDLRSLMIRWENWQRFTTRYLEVRNKEFMAY
jgi:hypothetical protein